MYQKILVPLDGSSLAEQALPHATDLAGKYNSSIYLIRVRLAPPAMWVGPDVMTPPALVQFQQYEIPLVKEYLEGIREQLRGQGLSDINLLTPMGTADEAIVSAAQEYGIDLIVMSSHGRSGVQRFLMGSVAERVVRHAACPTLVITIPSHREESKTPEASAQAER